MHPRSPSGTDVPTTSPHPIPAPPRWHLRTQVSRKTLFDLIQDTLPPSRLQVTNGPDGVSIGTDGANAERGTTGPGVVPQSYLDALAATAPMPISPAALWADGDTTPDIPEHWRPITISLASAPALSPPVLAPRAPSPTPRHPLQAIARTAGWMLSGAALTFLVSAAAFGGKPMLRAMRGVAAAQTQAAPDGTIPATQTTPPSLPVPARAPAPPLNRGALSGATVVALAERPEAKAHPAASASAGADDRIMIIPLTNQDGDASPDGDRATAAKNGAVPTHGAHRSHQDRQDRRLAKSATLTDAGRPDPSLSAADDAVMPLESTPQTRAEAQIMKASTPPTAALSKPGPSARAPVAFARTTASRTFRPIDVEDPFAGQSDGPPGRERKSSR